MRLIIAALLCVSVTVLAEVPKGAITKYTFDQSQIFPGTSRDYWIYVPQQYDPAKPACVHVNQDGVQFNAPAVFDQLIASKEMPVTIGIFVTPGRLKATSPNALDRFNRSYEYDAVNDNYVRFLLDELLPHIIREHKLNLSTHGNDRSIAGSSSGAICAFTAAWERPDAFRRVFSAIGTYVGLRGGDRYPTLIRKTEPKPLRVFLQDGSADQNIYCGDWWMANQTLERALVYAGYEVNHVWGDGGHSNKHGTEIFADVMRWLWKDWPAPIKTGLGSKQLQDLLIPGEAWQRAEMAPPPVNDAALSPDKSMRYIVVPHSHWVDSGQVQADGSLAYRQHYIWLHVPDDADDSGAGGISVDRDGRVYVATRMGVQVCDQTGRVNCILPVPGGACGNLWFDGDILFAACGNAVYKRKLKVTGVRPTDPPIRPTAPRL